MIIPLIPQLYHYEVFKVQMSKEDQKFYRRSKEISPNLRYCAKADYFRLVLPLPYPCAWNS